MDPDPPPLSVAAYLFSADVPLESGPLLIGVGVMLLLLLASALFSGSEVALFSLGPTAREQIALRGDRAGQRVLRLLERPRQLLISILILNTLVNVAASVVAAVMTAAVAMSMNVPKGLVVVLEVVVLTFVLLVISEITPKLLATRHAAAFSRTASLFLWPLHRLVFPLSNLLARSMQAVHGRIKMGTRRLSTDDLKAMAEIGEAHGTLEEAERELIHSIVEFSETTVREVMISRLDIVALPVAATLDEALDVIRTSGHSRLPLYVEHLDNILGIVHAKDLLRYLTHPDGPERVDWTRLARPTMFVPLGKKLDDLLKDFQAKKTHIAIVVDEYGGTAGLCTLENVLEEIVGDIRDEHDDSEEPYFAWQDEQTLRCDARLNLDDLDELLPFDLGHEDADFDFETLGGLIFHLSGTIPEEGDAFTYAPPPLDDGVPAPVLKLRVDTLENHRIGRVHVQIVPAVEPEEAAVDDPAADRR